MKVRVLKQYKIYVDNRFVRPGEEIDIPEELAKALASQGIVKLLEPITQQETVKKKSKKKRK